jgi:hypothetical protein
VAVATWVLRDVCRTVGCPARFGGGLLFVDASLQLAVNQAVTYALAMDFVGKMHAAYESMNFLTLKSNGLFLKFCESVRVVFNRLLIP